MRNRSKSWADIQMIISSIAVAATMGFWSLFSSSQKLTAGAAGTADLGQSDPNSATANNDMLLPGQVMLLGTPQAQASATPYVKVWRGGGKSKGGGSSGGGGGGGGSKTGSSKP